MLAVAAVVVLPACDKREPNSLFDAAGYHAYARDDQCIFYFTDQLTADLPSFRPLDGPYASDARSVYWMGKTIPGADTNTFRVLNADFECSADRTHAFYRQSVIIGAGPRSFPPGRTVTGCTETSICFAQ